MNLKVFHCWLQAVHTNEDALESIPGHTGGSHRWGGTMAPQRWSQHPRGPEFVQGKLPGGGQRKVKSPGRGGIHELWYIMKVGPNIKVFLRQMLLVVLHSTCSISANQEAFPCPAFCKCSFSFCFQAAQALMGAVDACMLSVTSCVSSSHAHF